jgi:hypothetical protein
MARAGETAVQDNQADPGQLLRSRSARWSQGKPLIFGRSGRVEVAGRQSSPTVESTPWPT